MPWCPNCKNEYVEGIKICADCGSELVESLADCAGGSENENPGFSDGYSDEAVQGGWEEDVDAPPEDMPQDMANAVRMGKEVRAAAAEGVYEDSAKKAEEFKSGAYTLLVVGVLGLAVLGVLISGALPVRLNPSSQWMTCLVMGALFIIFIVMGALSWQSSKKLAARAVREASLKEEMQAFCREKLDALALDADAQVLESDPEEMRYFKRTELLKERLSEAFSDAQGGYLDYFVDEIYPEIFGE